MIRSATCPICRRSLADLEPEAAKFAPFCSDRCRRVDFFRWSEGKYAIVEEIPKELLAEMGPEDFPEDYVPPSDS